MSCFLLPVLFLSFFLFHSISSVASRATYDTIEDFSPPTCESIHSRGMVFEETTPAYQRRPQYYDGLGPLSEERVSTVVKKIHFIFFNLDCQVMVVKTAKTPHYAAAWKEVLDFKKFTKSDIPFCVYYPNKSYENDFCVVRNGCHIRHAIQQIDFKKLASYCIINNVVKKAGGSVKRQQFRVDLGTTSSRCSSRRGSASGVALPGLHSRSKDSLIIDTSVQMTGLIRDISLPWMDAEYRPFGIQDESRDSHFFAKRIHPNNLVPAFSLHLSDETSYAGCHSDLLNSNSIPEIVTMSAGVHIKGVGDVRVGLTCFGRQSIDSALAERAIHGTYVDLICHGYDSFPVERRSLTSKSWASGQDVVCIPGLNVTKFPCNLDPWSFYSPWIWWTLSLVNKFKLTYLELIGCERAMACVPNSTYIFGAASKVLLDQPEINLIHRRSYNFGYLLLRLMCAINRTIRQQQRTLPPRRFANYREYYFPTYHEYVHECNCMLGHSLEAHRWNQTSHSVGEYRTFYVEQRDKLAAVLPLVDKLGSNHFIAVFSTLGTYPLWLCSHMDLHRSRAIAWMIDNHVPTSSRSNIRVEQMFLNIFHALKTRFPEERFTKRIVENIICKVYRKLASGNNSDRLFFDLHFPKQVVFSVDGDKVVGYLEGSGTVVEQGGSLIPKQLFKGKLTEYKDILNKVTAGAMENATLESVKNQLSMMENFTNNEWDTPFPLYSPVARSNRWLDEIFAIVDGELKTLLNKYLLE